MGLGRFDGYYTMGTMEEFMKLFTRQGFTLLLTAAVAVLGGRMRRGQRDGGAVAHRNVDAH